MKFKNIWYLLLLLIFFQNSCSLNKKNELKIYCWEDYISPQLIKKFEKDFSAKIIYTTYKSNEEMLSNLENKNDYDIIVPSGDYVQVLVSKNLVRKLDKSLLKNYVLLDNKILDKSMIFDSELSYTIPYFWGVCGLIYNTKFISFDDPNTVSWNILADNKILNSKKVSLLNDPRDLIGVSLIVNGFGPNYINEESLKSAESTIDQWLKNVLLLDSFDFKNNLINQKVVIAQAYNGDALQFLNTNKDFKFILPVEGSTLWIDYLMIGKNTKQFKLAHSLIDFLLEKDNALVNSIYTNYASPNIQVVNALPDSIKSNSYIYPNDNYLLKCHLVNNIDFQGESYLQTWQRIEQKISAE